jgi:hypothetical protein
MSSCVKSCSLEVPAGSVHALPYLFMSARSRNSIASGIDSCHLGAKLSWRTIPVLIRKGL